MTRDKCLVCGCAAETFAPMLSRVGGVLMPWLACLGCFEAGRTDKSVRDIARERLRAGQEKPS